MVTAGGMVLGFMLYGPLEVSIKGTYLGHKCPVTNFLAREIGIEPRSFIPYHLSFLCA